MRYRRDLPATGTNGKGWMNIDSTARRPLPRLYAQRPLRSRHAVNPPNVAGPLRPEPACGGHLQEFFPRRYRGGASRANNPPPFERSANVASLVLPDARSKGPDENADQDVTTRYGALPLRVPLPMPCWQR